MVMDVKNRAVCYQGNKVLGRFEDRPKDSGL